MDVDISQLEAPTFTTLDRGPSKTMMKLKWDHPVNLMGKKVRQNENFTILLQMCSNEKNYLKCSLFVWFSAIAVKLQIWENLLVSKRENLLQEGLPFSPFWSFSAVLFFRSSTRWSTAATPASSPFSSTAEWSLANTSSAWTAPPLTLPSVNGVVTRWPESSPWAWGPFTCALTVARVTSTPVADGRTCLKETYRLTFSTDTLKAVQLL